MNGLMPQMMRRFCWQIANLCGHWEVRANLRVAPELQIILLKIVLADDLPSLGQETASARVGPKRPFG